MVLDWVLLSALPAFAAVLLFPLLTLLAPCCAAMLLMERLAHGNAAERRRVQMSDTLVLHALYENTSHLADRISALEGGMRPLANEGDL